jgi:hypothetical protein
MAAEMGAALKFVAKAAVKLVPMLAATQTLAVAVA